MHHLWACNLNQTHPLCGMTSRCMDCESRGYSGTDRLSGLIILCFENDRAEKLNLRRLWRTLWCTKLTVCCSDRREQQQASATSNIALCAGELWHVKSFLCLYISLLAMVMFFSTVKSIGSVAKYCLLYPLWCPQTFYLLSLIFV